MHPVARFFVVLLGLAAVAAPSAAEAELSLDADTRLALDRFVAAELGTVVERYRDLHASPELSLEEGQTAARVAERLEEAGFQVTRGVGGHGVVSVFENGEGPVLWIRGDMDALPVTEETGLPYASEVVVEMPGGGRTGVMHACGHDVHTTNLVAVGRLLAELRGHWRGTAVLLAQPAEELGLGARAMLADGLLERFPRPAAVIALHVGSALAAGDVGLTAGYWAANVDSVDITVFGRGGHGARPHQANDPIVTAAHLVVALQTLVSRRVDPQEAAVVTVGSFHGGTKHNVIPDEVRLQLTVRSYTDEVRRQLLDGIRQLSEDVCASFGCTREPEVSVKETYTPAAYNDPELTARAQAFLAGLLGPDHVLERPPGMGGEDFGLLPRHAGVPGLLFRLGAVPRTRLEASLLPGGEPLPSLHSSRFAPEPEATLRTGMSALGGLALAILSPEPAAR